MLFTGEDKPLLVGWNTLLVLNLSLHIIDRVRGLDLQGDRLASQGLHEDLHATAKPEYKMESGLLLDIVVRQSPAVSSCFPAKMRRC